MDEHFQEIAYWDANHKRKLSYPFK